MTKGSTLSACLDDALPLLDAERRTRDSIHTALLEDKTPEILFDEDAIGDTDLDHEDDDVMSIEGSVVLEEDTKMLLYKSTGRVGSRAPWGLEPLARDVTMHCVRIDLVDGVLGKVEGLYEPSEFKDETQTRRGFDLGTDEVICKVHLFRVRREIHAIQFVTNERTSERYGIVKHGELCKAVEAPEGKCFAGFFGDVSRGNEEIDLGFRFADRPERTDTMEAEVEVAEIDHVN